MEEIEANQLNKSAFMGLTGLKCEIAWIRGGQRRVLGSPWAKGGLRGLGQSCIGTSRATQWLLIPSLEVLPNLNGWGLWRLRVCGEGLRH